MARHDIRGLKLSDGTYSLTSKDVYNLNDNFIQLSQEVFGNSSFTKKIEKQVLKNVKDIEEITYRVSDTEGNINDLELTATSLTNRISDAEGNVSTLQNTATSLTNRISDAEGNVSTLQNTATSLTNRISNAEGNVSTLQNTATSLTNRISNAEGNISTLQNTAQGLALDVAAADGRALNAQATADAVTLSFKTSGARNLLQNGDCETGFNMWQHYYHTGNAWFIGVRQDSWVENRPTHELRNDGSAGNYTEAFTTIYGLTPGKTYTVTMRLAGHNALNMFYMVNQAGNTIIGGYSETADNVLGGANYGDWKIIKKTFVASDPTMTIRLRCTNKITGTAYLWAKEMRINEGSESMVYMPFSNAVYGLSHTLDASGYTMRDSNGAEIMSLSKGVANEQNIGRVDNVEAGYPMKIPFHIGAEVSQITQAVLKWDMSQFRTYSKGAASGGGTKTTPSGGGSTSGSGGSTTVSVRDWTQGLAASTSNATITSSNLGQPHYHTVSTSNLSHRHDIPSHTHATPSHSHSVDITHDHAPVFGILETGITVDYTVGIEIDGVYRAQPNATRGIIDLSAWITTNGWHELILYVNGIKRLDANLFLKTYIRR